MKEAVFISDLHLHPEATGITEGFHAFLHWAAAHTQKVYILGDLFHVWAGDDCLDAWSRPLLEALQALSHKGVSVYFMHGNRDFLCGKTFAGLAGVTVLPDPALLSLSGLSVLLSHGDGYCLKDTGHQWFRRLTRNRLFIALFGLLPKKLRRTLVEGVRKRSQSRRSKPAEVYQVVDTALRAAMHKHKVTALIHGHTHTPGRVEHVWADTVYQQYVLDDWDDIPLILCYDNANGFEFVRLNTML